MDAGRGASAKSQPHKNRRGTAKAAPAHSNSVSVNALKSKIRDVSRVLEHAQDLPLDVRIEKERALAGYRQDLEKAQNEKERQRMIKKYHMVRFFGWFCILFLNTNRRSLTLCRDYRASESYS